MNDKYNKHLILVCSVVLAGCVGVMGYAVHEANQQEIVEQVMLEVTDKSAPAIDMAGDAESEAIAWQEEQDRLAEEAAAAYYYAPSYSYYDSDYDDMSDQDYIAWRESGADYEARNGRYYGKYQMDESRLNGDYSPENQEAVAEQYMLDRYGSWEAAREFWDSHGWW